MFLGKMAVTENLRLPQGLPVFQTLADPKARRLFWRLLGSQMKMGIPCYDALEQMKHHDFNGMLPADMRDMVEVWQAQQKTGEKGVADFFLDYVARADFEEGLRMWISAKTGSLCQAIYDETA